MLYGNNLRGELSAVPSLGNLSRITFLGMHNNELSGRFPEAILRLSSLNFLDLAENNLTGSLPTDFFIRLPRLSIIFLCGNHFEGRFPQDLSPAKLLQFLSIDRNNFSGSLPSVVSATGDLQSGLQIFEAANNNFEGVVPASLLTNLMTLWIGGNSKLVLPATVSSRGGRPGWARPICSTASPSPGVQFENGVVPPWLAQWIRKEAEIPFATNFNATQAVQQCDLRGSSAYSCASSCLLTKRC